MEWIEDVSTVKSIYGEDNINDIGDNCVQIKLTSIGMDLFVLLQCSATEMYPKGNIEFSIIDKSRKMTIYAVESLIALAKHIHFQNRGSPCLFAICMGICESMQEAYDQGILQKHMSIVDIVKDEDEKLKRIVEEESKPITEESTMSRVKSRRRGRKALRGKTTQPSDTSSSKVSSDEVDGTSFPTNNEESQTSLADDSASSSAGLSLREKRKRRKARMAHVDSLFESSDKLKEVQDKQEEDGTSGEIELDIEDHGRNFQGPKPGDLFEYGTLPGEQMTQERFGVWWKEFREKNGIVEALVRDDHLIYPEEDEDGPKKVKGSDLFEIGGVKK
ncbi:hypothetical protein ADUPG1_013622 [Aduncisulcus paluster]|uniref:RWD domain-containing protein n=1 Tax=Aduncisulcus paluster TaxID=2918883 RepID=A0ABQ5K3J7_9EUKA|nr:hypothetical protein ADUPG1_013622 [Aduncisulcus paluster]